MHCIWIWLIRDAKIKRVTYFHGVVEIKILYIRISIPTVIHQNVFISQNRVSYINYFREISRKLDVSQKTDAGSGKDTR